MSHHPSLIAAFDRLDVPADLRALIINHHSEAHRHYHTLRHIDLMLRQLPVDHAHAPEMIAATLFHDIIYDPTRSDNEELSLAMFQSAASRLATPKPLDEPLVFAMILATKSHHFRDDNPEGEAINHLLKADLSILWHPDPQVYAWYAAGVRKEYAFVPEDRFQAARTKILQQLRHDLLNSKQITDTETKTMTLNIAWELRGLGI
ncbi:HD domain-containing protein [Novosphingobium terrae]|uniref:HD domain-containing protein n=1 Tax=Novosphingobium terrae TaxID=2726189 RepID=UPI00197FBC4F|nr:hypothetical protein [Novosphingobium terrae]